ncbi:hypothetical protein [Actinoplanes aureus]|uniref:Uncharacterized protein n=1 Tax=Actinoplanes aureus TaxID=2792083 RepID=A0A931G3U5_9ACTN|nr:hypothetical protein [Actinoplanes aureus]MBG0564599.1 hypothetical protein [Actinoplanes aureus]
MAATTVSHREFTTLLGLRHRVGLPPRDVRCELATGHEGSHMAFALAAAGGDEWWWARWTTGGCEVVPLDPCDTVCPAEHDDCLLPAGHAGPHSFQF